MYISLRKMSIFVGEKSVIGVLALTLILLLGQLLALIALPHYQEYPYDHNLHRTLSLETGEDDPSIPFGERPYKIVAFYHIYAEGKDYHRIVREQVSFIKNTQLLDQLDTIFYTTVGNGNFTFHHIENLSDDEKQKFLHLKHFGNKGNEENTIKKLYHFCHHHPKTKVLYFHDKGSYHANKLNEEFRHNLNCYTLTPSCIEALDSFDTCGMRATPMPFIHYSGNFWWAKCNYISQLVDPMSFYTNKTFANLTSKINPCVNGGQRYFAEAWVGSHPHIQPADCVDAKTDNTYFYAYHFPASFRSHCPNRDQSWGAKCGNASILVEPEKFIEGYNRMRDISGDLCQEDIPAEVTKRSYIWYGQEPTTYLNWISKLIKTPNLIEKKVYKTSADKQVYWYRNGTMHAVPSIRVLVRLGYEISDIITIPAYQMKTIKIGPDLKEKADAYY